MKCRRVKCRDQGRRSFSFFSKRLSQRSRLETLENLTSATLTRPKRNLFNHSLEHSNMKPYYGADVTLPKVSEVVFTEAFRRKNINAPFNLHEGELWTLAEATYIYQHVQHKILFHAKKKSMGLGSEFISSVSVERNKLWRYMVSITHPLSLVPSAWEEERTLHCWSPLTSLTQ